MKKNLGMMIAELRKQKGMTQLDLANKIGVSDKAVSKWERNLSCPDIHSLPMLAEILGTSIEELMQVKNVEDKPKKDKTLLELIPKAIALAMGVSVVVLTIINEIEIKAALTMLAIGMICISISLLQHKS